MQPAQILTARTMKYLHLMTANIQASDQRLSILNRLR